jgi:hypothetical protein
MRKYRGIELVEAAVPYREVFSLPGLTTDAEAGRVRLPALRCAITANGMPLAARPLDL